MTCILVEGNDDESLIKFLLKQIGITEDLYEIIQNGSHGINGNKVNILKEAIAQGKNLIIINDANSNFTTRNQELENDVKKYSLLSAKIFLIPNNKDNGELETLLLECVNDENNTIFHCFDGFNKCLKDDKSGIVISPLELKDKIYNYVDVQLNENEKKDRNKKKNSYYFEGNAKSKKIWNFDAPYLNPLKEFLEDNVK